MSACLPVKVREQLLEVYSVLPPCGARGLNSGSQAWQQMLLRPEPPHSPPTWILSC